MQQESVLRLCVVYVHTACGLRLEEVVATSMRTTEGLTTEVCSISTTLYQRNVSTWPRTAKMVILTLLCLSQLQLESIHSVYYRILCLRLTIDGTDLPSAL